MSGQILTFSNLFPSATRPHHGRFVQERMKRVAAQTGLAWRVVSPVPRVPSLLRRGVNRKLAKMPAREVVDGTELHNVHYFHLPGVSMRRQANRIAKACLPIVRELCRGVPTVIDAHYAYPDGVAAMTIADELDLPCVVTARGTDLIVLAEQPGVREQMRRALRGAKARFAVSEDLRGRFEALLSRDGEEGRVQLARNGVDLDVFAIGDQAAARRALGLPVDKKLLLGVGRLVEVKGFHRAAAAMAEMGGDSVLVLVGEGPLRARIADLLPPERLMFLGGRLQHEVAQACQACDLMVLPTTREGWPNVVTEALACGLPIVTAPTGGIPDILTDASLAAMVDPHDRPALITALQRFLDAPPDRVDVRRLAAGYSWADTVSLLSDLFLDSLP